MAKKGVIFLEGDTQFMLSTTKYTNNTGGQVTGISFNLNLPTGTEVVSVIDNNNASVNSTTNGSIEVIGPVTVAAGASIQFHITVGIAELSTTKCPLNLTGYFSDADDCILAGTEIDAFPQDCISCSNINTCISAAQAVNSSVKAVDYTVQTTDGVIYADNGVTTITLTASPLANQEVVIKNIDGATLTVSGNGNNIDGAASYSMTSLDETIKLKYSSDTGEWEIIGKSLKTGKDVFTPTVSYATAGDSSFTYNTANGIGYQIGNLYYFHVDLDFDTNAFTTATGAMKIDGLPNTPLANVAANISNLGNAVIGGNENIYAEVDTNADILIGVSGNGIAAALADETQFPPSTTNITIRISGFFEI